MVENEFSGNNVIKALIRAGLLLVAIVVGFIGMMFIMGAVSVNSEVSRLVFIIPTLMLALSHGLLIYGILQSWKDKSNIKWLNIALRGVFILIFALPFFAGILASIGLGSS